MRTRTNRADDKAIIPSNVKVGPTSVTIHGSLTHEDEIWSVDESDTISVMVADAPRPCEIMLVITIRNGTRRCPDHVADLTAA